MAFAVILTTLCSFAIQPKPDRSVHPEQLIGTWTTESGTRIHFAVQPLDPQSAFPSYQPVLHAQGWLADTATWHFDPLAAQPLRVDTIDGQERFGVDLQDNGVLTLTQGTRHWTLHRAR